jgi:hypothetical protein
MLALRVLKVPLVLKVLELKAAKAHQVLLVPKGTWVLKGQKVLKVLKVLKVS